MVIAYYDRQYQLNKTLESIASSKHDNFEVVIVDDNSPEDIVIPETKLTVHIIKPKERKWTNVAPIYNMGFLKAIELGAQKIFIQSAECYHVGDVLADVEQRVKGQYVAYGCFQIDKETTFKDHDIIELSKRCAYKVDGDNKGQGVNAWWNHSEYSPLPQYWGAAISTENLIKVNGIDERFAFGYAYEDGWFLYQLENAGIKTEIVNYPFVVHQWHSRKWANTQARKDPGLLERNLNLYLTLRETKEFKSKHFITPDLCGI